MNKYLLFIGYLLLSLLIACSKEKDNGNGGGPLENFHYNFALVDEKGNYLFDSIDQLPFNPKQSYFVDAGGVKRELIFFEGHRHPVTDEEIGVTFSTHKNHIGFDNLEGKMDYFTWLVYLSPTLSPDTFTVYGAHPGTIADSAYLNRNLFLPKDTLLTKYLSLIPLNLKTK